eukprot:1145009-Pelagomonas_calceolata.AAC.1
MNHTAPNLVLHLPSYFQKFTNHTWPASTTYKAFYRTKLAGLHEAIISAPTSFASELQGLLARKTKLGNKYASKKVKDSFSRALPTHIHTAPQEWAL